MGKAEKAAMIAAGAVTAGLAARAILRRTTEPNLSGRIALVTGGSRGLGFALACEFARQGCRVAICSRDRGELDRAASDPRLRPAALALECDVTDRNDVNQMIDRVLDRFGTIDFLVTNAGEIRVGPLESMSMQDFRDAMDVMFWGTVYPTMALLPHLLRRGSGSVVHITSIGGKVAVPHLLPYDCAKFAAVGFSEGLRAELTGTGVKVTTIVPGLMRTGSYLNAGFKGDADREAAWFGVSASLPGITISAARAARQIVAAAKRGDAERILTVPARAMAIGHGLFPGVTASVLGWVNRYLLPSGTASGLVRGGQTEALQARPMRAVTALGRKAAQSLHQHSERHPVEVGS